MNNILLQLVKRYESGESLSILEKESGIYRQKIIRAIKEIGIPLKGSKSFSNYEEGKITEEYLAGSKTKSLSLKYKVSSPCILSIVRRHNGKVRKNSDENRKYAIKENFFNQIDCAEKAYILGLFYADGCNSKTKRISISLTGQEESEGILMKKIVSLLYYGEDNPLTFKDGKWMLTIVNKGIAEQLALLGMVQRKSLILKFPKNDIVNEKFVRHFIRGYFDGDGSIMLQRNKTKTIISFVGTFEFLTALNGILKQNDILGNIYRASSPSGKLFDLRIYDKKSIDNFYNFVYDMSTIWLSRKRDKFSERKIHEKHRDNFRRRN